MSISANVRVGAGVRLISCIILDDVEIKVLNWMPEKSKRNEIHNKLLFLLMMRSLFLCTIFDDVFS